METNPHHENTDKTAIEKTVEWYLDEDEADVKCIRQINEYFQNVIDGAEGE